MVGEIRELLRLTVTRDVPRRRVRHGLQAADAPRDERRVAQRSGANREVEAFGDEIDDPTRQ